MVIQDVPTKPDHLEIARVNQSKQPGNLSVFAVRLPFQLGFFLEIEESKQRGRDNGGKCSEGGFTNYKGIFSGGFDSLTCHWLLFFKIFSFGVRFLGCECAELIGI